MARHPAGWTGVPIPLSHGLRSRPARWTPTVTCSVREQSSRSRPSASTRPCNAGRAQLFALRDHLGFSLGTFFRYIGDTGTYIARYDDLVNGKEEKIDLSRVAVSMNGIELKDREFFAAIAERREPNASVAQVLPCYKTLRDLENILSQQE